MKNEPLFIGAVLLLGASVLLSATAHGDVTRIAEIPHIDEVDLRPHTDIHRGVGYTENTMYAAGVCGMLGLGVFALYYIAEKNNANVSFRFRHPEKVKNTIMKED